MCTNILDVSRPAAREDYWSAGSIECLSHVGVTSLIDLGRGIAAIQLQHVHAPRCKRVGICLNVVQSARIAATGMRTYVCNV